MRVAFWIAMVVVGAAVLGVGSRVASEIAELPAGDRAAAVLEAVVQPSILGLAFGVVLIGLGAWRERRKPPEQASSPRRVLAFNPWPYAAPETVAKRLERRARRAALRDFPLG